MRDIAAPYANTECPKTAMLEHRKGGQPGTP
jgi:hypothetical protein